VVGATKEKRNADLGEKEKRFQSTGPELCASISGSSFGTFLGLEDEMTTALILAPFFLLVCVLHRLETKRIKKGGL
jgi:hypothetical protein